MAGVFASAAHVLADSSVWMTWFRFGAPALDGLLQQDRICIHPMIIGEIACGTPPQRQRILADLSALRPVVQAHHGEVLTLIERERLYGAGCGWVDMHLLASTRLTPQTCLWTLDKRLAILAERLGFAYAVQRSL